MRILCTVLVLLISISVASAESKDPSASYRFLVQSIYQADDDGSKTTSSFDIKRARVVLDGSVNDRLSAHATIETRDADGVVLLQGHATYAFDTRLMVRAGQMYVPFGLESRRGFNRRDFFDRSYVTDRVTRDMGRRPADGRNARFRDIGVAISGGIPLRQEYELSYTAMVFNGNGILTEDNNDAKDVAGRLSFSLPHGLAVGGSAYFGRAVDTAAGDLDEWAFGVELAWAGRLLTGEAYFRTEYIRAEWETAGEAVSPHGFYVAGTMSLMPALKAAARYEMFESDRHAEPGDLQRRLSLALRYELGGGNLVAVDYEIRDHDSDDPGNRLTVQFLADFGG